MLMGRNTYEMFSRLWASPDDDYAAAIHGMQKYVFSTTLEQADWNNTKIVRADVATAVGDLRQLDGKDIVLYGHGPLGQALLEADLLDELNLWIHPVFVGPRDQALPRRQTVRTAARTIEDDEYGGRDLDLRTSATLTAAALGRSA
jgi:dihydrofolate reductase